MPVILQWLVVGIYVTQDVRAQPVCSTRKGVCTTDKSPEDLTTARSQTDAFTKPLDPEDFFGMSGRLWYIPRKVNPNSAESPAEDLPHHFHTPLGNVTSSNPGLLAQVVDAESRQPTSHCSNQTRQAIAGKQKIRWRLLWKKHFESDPAYKHLQVLHKMLYSKIKYKSNLRKYFVDYAGDAKDAPWAAEYEIVTTLDSAMTDGYEVVIRNPPPNDDMGGSWINVGKLHHKAHIGEHAYLLFIEGDIQSTSIDEHIYHEAFVHPALTLLPDAAQSVFIGGGAEGLTLREVLRHESVQSVVMVDIDDTLMDACHDLLGKNFNNMSFEDRRAQVIAGDARAYLEQNGKDLRTFDVIILDFPDFGLDLHMPGDFGGLFTSNMYSAAKQRLRDGGILVLQAPFYGECAILRTLQTSFRYVDIIAVPMFSYSANLFFLASDNPFHSIDPDIVDQRLAARVKGQLHFYRGSIHSKLWALNATIATSSECLLQGCVVIDNTSTIDPPAQQL
jgi:spermidine synthase